MENREFYDLEGLTLDDFKALDSCRIFVDPAYRPPTPEEIRLALKIAGLTGGQAARWLGLSESRTVRRWTGGERQMPYSTWRLLLILGGITSAQESIPR